MKYIFLKLFFTLLILQSCNNDEGVVTEKNLTSPKNIENINEDINKIATKDEANSKYNSGDYSCYFYFQNQLSSYSYKDNNEKSSLLLKLGVCNFFNTKEKHFILSNQIEDYDNYSTAYNFFQQVQKPLNNVVKNDDGTESQIVYYEMARYYMALCHYYGEMGRILIDHKKALELFKECDFENNIQSSYIQLQANLEKEYLKTSNNKHSDNPYVLYGSPSKYIANIYIMNLTIEPDETKFIEYMKKAADNQIFQDPEASYFLGMYYFSIKDKNTENKTLAKKYIQKSHELGFSKAKEFWDEEQMYKLK